MNSGALNLVQLRQRAAAAKKAHRKLCQEDFSEFATFVLRDEETGKPIHPGWIHRKWGQIVRNHKRVAFLAQTELGKSQQLSVAYILWRIGRNPRLRCALVSNSQTGAEKLVRQIQNYILSSTEYQEIFPNVTQGTLWKSDRFEIVRPGGSLKDPTVAAYGLDSKSIMGSRLDLVILDDVDNYASTYTDLQRDKVDGFVTTSVFSRLTKHHQVIIVGNAWHKEDLIHRLKKRGYPLYVCPAVVTDQVLKQWPDCPYKKGEPLWPEWWSPERLAEKKAETSSREWNRAMMCVPMSDDMSLFKEYDFKIARKRGDGLGVTYSIEQLLTESGFSSAESVMEMNLMQGTMLGTYVPETVDEAPAFKIVHGFDMSTGRANDKSAIVTICQYDDGTRRLLNVQTGHWQGNELLKRIHQTYISYGGIFAVESVGMQRAVFDLMRENTMIPIIPFPTTWKDKTIGFSTISAEFTARKWIIPSQNEKAPEAFEELLTGLYDYNAHGHTDDSAMALLFAVGLLRGLEAFESGASPTLNVSFVG